MRTRDSLYVLVSIAIACGCMSEGVLDNYHDGSKNTLEVGGGGARGLEGAVAQWEQQNNPSAALTVSGYVSLMGGRSSVTSAPNLAGAAGATSPEQAYQMAGYWSLDTSVTRIELGTTASDHLIAIYEAPASSGERGFAGVSSVQLCMIELASTGEQLRQVIFEEGRMPDVFSVMPDGSVVLAALLDRDISYDGPTISRLDHGVFVTKLDADWRHEYAFAIPTDRDFAIKDMALDKDGSVFLALSEQNASSAAPQHLLLGYGSDGKERFRASSFAANAIVLDGSDRVLAIGTSQVDDTVIGPAPSAANGGDGLLVSFDRVSQRATAIGQFGGMDVDVGTVLGLGPDAHLRIGGQVRQNARIFGETLNGDALGSPFVAEIDSEGAARFSVTLGAVGTITDLVQQGRDTFVAGYLDDEESSGTNQAGGLYAAVVQANGVVSSIYRVKARAKSSARLAVGSGGTIWLHGMADVGGNGNEFNSAVLVRLVPQSI